MRHFLNAALLTTLFASGVVGCRHDQPAPGQSNRLNAATSTGNSQQATEPPTNPTAMPPTSGPTMQP